MANPFDAIPIATVTATTRTNPFDAIEAPKADITPDSIVRSLASGASFGLADEFAAMMDAATHPVLGRGATADTYGQRYEQNLAKERGQDKAYAEQHPVANIAGNIAGGLGTAIAAAPFLPAVATSVGPSALVNVGKAALGGAALGGAQGFGEGEGLSDRLGRAAVGAGIGGAVGAAARPIAAVGRSIAETLPGRLIGDYIVNPVAQLPGKIASSVFQKEAPLAADSVAQSGALERLATALQREPSKTPGQLAERARYLGPETTLSDVSEQFRGAATGAKVMQGETRSLAPDVLLSREAGAPARMKAGFTGENPPQSTHELMSEDGQYAQNLRAVGADVYGKMADAGFKNSPGISRMLTESPEIEKAVDRVLASEKAARLGTDRPPASPVEIMHMVKRDIQNIGLDGQGRPTSTAYQWQQTANDFVRQLKAANKPLAEADKAYAQAASLPEHFQQGYDFLRPVNTTERGLNASSPALTETLKNANPQQRASLQAGNINQVVDLLSGRKALPNAQSLAKDIPLATELQARLGEIHGPQKLADILRRAEAENVYKTTTDKLIRGSQTAEKTSDALEQAGNIGVRLSPSGGVIPQVKETLGAFTRWVRSPNEAIRNEVGKLTLNPNATENEKTLALLAKLLAQRSVGTAGNVGIAGAAGQQAGGL